MRQFEQTLGVVENIDTTSRQLKDALESGKTIVVTTLQKFPVIAKEVGELPGKRFALIVDEAHSSQSGESTKSLKAVLASGSLEDADRAGQDGVRCELPEEPRAGVPEVEGSGSSTGGRLLREERAWDREATSRQRPGVHSDAVRWAGAGEEARCPNR